MDVEEKKEIGDKPPKEEEVVQPPKKKKKFFKYFLLLQGSMVIVFFTVWFAVNRMESAKHMEEQAAEEALNDSTQVTPETVTDAAPADSSESTNEDKMQDDEKFKLLEQMAMIKEQLAQKLVQMREMSVAAKEREKLAAEIDQLKITMVDKEKELEYFRDTLPERVADKLADQQGLNVERGGGTDGGQQATVGQQTAVQQESAQTGTNEQKTGIRKLAKIYEAMRPEEAAPILARMDDEEIVEILLRMRQRSAAKLMSNLDPVIAARISKRIGDR